MHRALFTIAIALFLGCDGDSSPKKQTAKPIGDDGPVEKTVAVSGEKPATMDATAKQAVADLLGAHTKGQPSLFAAFRNCVVRRKGEMNFGDAMQQAECADRFAWPNRFRSEWRLGGNPMPTLTIFAVDDAVSSIMPGQEKPVPLDPAQTTNSLEDIRATWLTMLVPLGDSSGFVAAIEKDSLPNTLAIRVWIGTQPPQMLLVDVKTGLLNKVLFEKVTDGRRETWAFVLSEMKPVNGVLLPSKITFTAGRKAMANWNAIEYEAVPSFAVGTFEKP